MPNIKYGSRDGCAARYTDEEAWVLVDGTWRKSHPIFFLFTGRAPLTKKAYREAFGDVPPLPDNAFDSHRTMVGGTAAPYGTRIMKCGRASGRRARGVRGTRSARSTWFTMSA
jgi:hypothetical protein